MLGIILSGRDDIALFRVLKVSFDITVIHTRSLMHTAVSHAQKGELCLAKAQRRGGVVTDASRLVRGVLCGR